VAARPASVDAALRVAVPVEQFWHRVPGGTARATRGVLDALAGGHPEINVQGVAAWHGSGERHRVGGLCPVVYLPLPRRALYEGWLRLGRPLVERFVGPVDVVWASSMVPVATRAPMVATVHDLAFLDQPEHASRRGRSFFPRAWAAVVERASFIVCPSQVVADDCARRGASPDRIRVVPWGVDPPISAPEAAAVVRRAHDLPERFVLWVGTLEPRKNLTGLVEAMSRVKGLDLVVVGPEGWNLDGADLLAPLGARAHRIGVVDDHTLSALYRAASVFAFPSLAEGFGLPVLEAMAHGTPVVTSVGAATAEVAGTAARLVEPTDPAAIARAIEATLDEAEHTRELVRAGRRRARELSWARAADGYASVLTEATGAQR
jgi:glycosyltransferase involved in cell wall biosynthesis